MKPGIMSNHSIKWTKMFKLTQVWDFSQATRSGRFSTPAPPFDLIGGRNRPISPPLDATLLMPRRQQTHVVISSLSALMLAKSSLFRSFNCCDLRAVASFELTKPGLHRRSTCHRPSDPHEVAPVAHPERGHWRPSEAAPRPRIESDFPRSFQKISKVDQTKFSICFTIWNDFFWILFQEPSWFCLHFRGTHARGACVKCSLLRDAPRRRWLGRLLPGLELFQEVFQLNRYPQKRLPSTPYWPMIFLSRSSGWAPAKSTEALWQAAFNAPMMHCHPLKRSDAAPEVGTKCIALLATQHTMNSRRCLVVARVRLLSQGLPQVAICSFEVSTEEHCKSVGISLGKANVFGLAYHQYRSFLQNHPETTEQIYNVFKLVQEILALRQINPLHSRWAPGASFVFCFLTRNLDSQSSFCMSILHFTNMLRSTFKEVYLHVHIYMEHVLFFAVPNHLLCRSFAGFFRRKRARCPARRMLHELRCPVIGQEEAKKLREESPFRDEVWNKRKSL